MSEETYKDEFIRVHGEIAYAEKLLKNAKWRAENSEKMAEYAEKRSRNGRSESNTVLFIGDIHLGSSGTDIDEVKSLAKKYWSRNPIILMGDICDLGIDRGMNWDNKFGPEEQLDIAREIFQPLDIRAWCEGNHCNRIWNKVGIDPFKEMLGKPSSNELTLGGRKLFFNHGISAAQDPFREHQRYIKWKNASIYCLGHSHVLGKLSYMRDGEIVHLCRTGSLLRPVKYTKIAGYDPKIRGWIEYNTKLNFVHLKAINEDTGEIYEI